MNPPTGASQAFRQTAASLASAPSSVTQLSGCGTAACAPRNTGSQDNHNTRHGILMCPQYQGARCAPRQTPLCNNGAMTMLSRHSLSGRGDEGYLGVNTAGSRLKDTARRAAQGGSPMKASGDLCIYLPYGIRHSTSPPPLQGVLAPVPSGQVKLAGGVLARRMCSEGVHLVVHSSCGSNLAGL